MLLKKCLVVKGNYRKGSFTKETKSAVVQTLHRLYSLVPELLNIDGVEYVLIGKLQSDCLEGEFGVIRQMSGGCYFVSVEQVFMSSKLRRIKLYTELNLLSPISENCNRDCCKSILNSQELDLIDSCCNGKYDQIMSDEELSFLYYISFVVISLNKTRANMFDRYCSVR